MDKTPQVVLATLIQLMAEKMYEPISKVKGWVNVQIEIAVARLYSWVLRRARFPKSLVGTGAGLGFKSGIGFGAMNILRQERFVHICAKSPIQIQPSHYIYTMRFVRATQQPPLDGRMGQDGAHRYKPRK